MSERGAWTSEFIYCERCLKEMVRLLREGFGEDNKYFTLSTTPPWPDYKYDLPILHGKIGGLAPGEEVIDFTTFAKSTEVASSLCHRVRLCVFPDTGEGGFLVLEVGEGREPLCLKLSRSPVTSSLRDL